MSKTERDLASDGSVDALDGLFDDAEFDDALESALEDADAHLPVDDETSRVEDQDPVDDIDDLDDLDQLDDVDQLDGDVELDEAGESEAGLDLDDAAETDLAPVTDVDEHLDADDAIADDLGSDEVAVDDIDDIGDIGDIRDIENDDDDTDAAAAIDAAATVETETGVDDDFPVIVPATDDVDVSSPDESGPIATEAFVEEELHPDEVAEEILEELRRADIDGPQVEMAPQDESTAARRRPKRAVDYDPAPVPIPARVPRVLARKPRVRRVTRVVRHVDPWSVFKIAIVANLVLYIIVLTAGVLLWNVAHATGTVDNVERFFESFGWASFEFNGGEIYNAAWVAGLFIVIGLTGIAVLLATLFNLITDLVGGVRFTVLEEEVVETRTSPLRRFVVRRPEPEVPAKLNDQSGAMYREAVVDDTGANQRPSR